MTSHAFGDLIMPSAFRPEFDLGGEQLSIMYAQRRIGCLDAPTMMPAGACERYELRDGSYAFPASQLCVRGFEGEPRRSSASTSIRRIDRNTYDEEGRN